MRQVKFRGLSEENVWHYGSLLIDEYSNNSYITKFVGIESGETIYDWILVKPETVGQCVGLYDGNRKDIYEGDILRVTEQDWEEEWNGTVEWGNEYPAFTLNPNRDLEYNSLQHACLVVSCEIIGNIHQSR